MEKVDKTRRICLCSYLNTYTLAAAACDDLRISILDDSELQLLVRVADRDDEL